MNGSIPPLPEAMIQHIQSFLTGKEAAQTTILSKSWYNAWLTRPNINLDQCAFYRTRNRGFHYFAEKTIKRYEDSNLNIVSFKLNVVNFVDETEYFSVHQEYIVRAIKLGATDLELKFSSMNDFALPHEVFEAETLIRLSVSRCKIYPDTVGKVNCSKLRFLSLQFVYVRDDIIGDIISICPMIEELEVYNCKLMFEDPSYSSSVYHRERVSLATGFAGGKEFPKMTCLWLSQVNVGDLFFSDFSSKFPCLKKLSIAFCDGYKGVVIELSSPSLEHITFRHYYDMLRVKFSTPSIRKFTFWGDQLPSLCFEGAPSKWESSINLECKSISTSWLLELSKLLVASNLSTSRVSLFLKVVESFVEKSFDHPGNVQALPILDRLTLRVRPPFSSSLLQGLFLSFRPKLLNPLFSKPLSELFCKTVVYKASDNCYVPNRKFDGLCDLEAVDVEELVESLAGYRWQGLPWHILLDASTNPNKEWDLRFQLRWSSG